ncbi:MAG: metallophosphoesterase family protein [Candidatus Competibacterales bacterium]|nr:metallophosphoesterase family protein [Candidatus Competibacterales bacterium]
MILLHISDLHFGAPYLEPVGEALLAKIHELEAEAIVVSGDLTQRAKPAEFRRARDFLDRLPPVPQVVVPGNHDVPLYRIGERLLRPRALYRRHISSRVNDVLYHPDATIVGLDSTDPYRALTNGRIRARQLDYCARQFERAPPEALRVVVLHHHLIPAPTFERPPPMPRAKRALEAFTRLEIDLVLAGHLHRAYVGNSLDVYGGEQRTHGIVIAQCGTSTSRRGRGFEREKNTFNWIRLSRKTIQVVHYMYFEDGHDFAPITRHEFVRPTHDRLPGGLPWPDRKS